MKYILSELQKQRNFEVESYVKEKTRLINEFFSSNNLNSAVIGLSGGIDSSVSIMLLKKASSMKGSPIKKILGIIVPIVGSGTTHQVEATSNAVSLVRSHGIDSNLVDLTDAFNIIIERTNPAFVHFHKIVRSNEKSDSKLASALRTSSIYYHREILENLGFRSVVIGTINRDEGSYIGYFDKSSDAIADIQLIADLHKSELIQLGYHLGVPPKIIDQSPRGDHYDKRTDEEIIGVPFWFIEMYLLIKEYNYSHDMLNDPEYQKYSKIIEDLHQKNRHKYHLPLYCHFLDVMSRKVPGGWL